MKLSTIDFLIKYWKIITTTCLFGLVCVVIVIFTTPNTYKATAYVVTKVQIDINTPNYGFILDGPNEIIIRFSNPTIFDKKSLEICGEIVAGKPNNIKILPVANINNWIQINTTSDSPEKSIKCTETIFELIKNYQDNILDNYINTAKIKLKDNNIKLKNAKDLILRSDFSESIVGTSYLATRDEIRFLLEELNLLNNFITNSENYTAKLVGKPYVEMQSRKKLIYTLLFKGLFFGFLIGLLLSYSIENYFRYFKHKFNN